MSGSFHDDGVPSGNTVNRSHGRSLPETSISINGVVFALARHSNELILAGYGQPAGRLVQSRANHSNPSGFCCKLWI